MLQLGVRRNHGRREHVRSRSGCGGLIAARCSAVDSMCFPSTLTARGTSSSLQFAGSRPRCDLVCSQWGKPATSLRLIPRVECWRLRSLASAGDYRELIRAVKSCTTGLVQRRCQRKRTHHPLCCHLLSWWAGGNVAEACVCGKARTLSLFHSPRFACRLRHRCGSRDLGWNPQARARSAASCRHPLWEARRGFSGWSRRSPRS